MTAFLALATVLARSARVARRVVAADKADWSWERWDGGILSVWQCLFVGTVVLVVLMAGHLLMLGMIGVYW